MLRTLVLATARRPSTFSSVLAKRYWTSRQTALADTFHPLALCAFDSF